MFSKISRREWRQGRHGKAQRAFDLVEGEKITELVPGIKHSFPLGSIVTARRHVPPTRDHWWGSRLGGVALAALPRRDDLRIGRSASTGAFTLVLFAAVGGGSRTRRLPVRRDPQPKPDNVARGVFRSLSGSGILAWLMISSEVLKAGSDTKVEEPEFDCAIAGTPLRASSEPAANSWRGCYHDRIRSASQVAVTDARLYAGIIDRH